MEPFRSPNGFEDLSAAVAALVLVGAPGNGSGAGPVISLSDTRFVPGQGFDSAANFSLEILAPAGYAGAMPTVNAVNVTASVAANQTDDVQVDVSTNAATANTTFLVLATRLIDGARFTAGFFVVTP